MYLNKMKNVALELAYLFYFISDNIYFILYNI